jgi:hypothetical protein
VQRVRADGPMVASLAALLACLVNCGGGPASPSEAAPAIALPVVTTSCTPIGSGNTATYRTIFFVSGLSDKVADAAVRPLEAVLRVGEEVRLSLEWDGCAYTRNETWISSNPAVASFGEPSFSGLGNTLAAQAPGEVDISVQFEGPDGKVYRTYPAYCPASQYACFDPRTPFTRVRVIVP